MLLTNKIYEGNLFMRYSKHLTYAERMFLRARLNRVRHITLDPDGPGVVRIHLVPCHKPDRETPFTAILNGQDILPLNVSWAILLTNFIEALKPYTGKEIRPEEWSAINAQAVAATRKIYRKTEYAQIESDLKTLVDCLCTIARGGEPPLSIEPVSLADYAPRMAAPHRMDLMVSSMVKDGAWHCNQKCLHCYAANQPLSAVPELDTDQWLAVIEKCRNAGIPQLTFTGGEPTLRHDLVKLVQAAQWFVTRLNTNGRMLTSMMCKDLHARQPGRGADHVLLRRCRHPQRAGRRGRLHRHGERHQKCAGCGPERQPEHTALQPEQGLPVGGQVRA